MTTGLLLGKFAPLHRGHQLLMETALAENEQVLAMIYHAPDVTDVPLPVRAGWIRDIYPRVEVIEAWDGPLEVGDAPELQRRHEEYILSRLAGRRVDRFYSSEFYGAHVSRALQAEDRRVDEARQQVPISATAIRADPYNNRHFLEPRVYRDLVSRVVLLGAPSTGKTTLAEALARHHATCWMPEYGREYWARHQQDRRLSPQQLLEIAEGHRRREDVLMTQANRFLFVDTDASTTRHFARYYHGWVDPRLEALAEETARRYDLFLLCEDDIPYDDSWDRSGEGNRRIMQAQIRAELTQRRMPYFALKGSLAERLQQVEGILRRFRKYPPLAESLAVQNDRR
ncbi:MAG: AAA family ATPase [Gammaproteobacteria bacterium]|nr:AAA family ATPase [Gammaproteobacteria bacterium]